MLGPLKSSARFTIAIGRALGAVVVTVHGELDVPGAAHLGSVLADLINSQDEVGLIIDLHDAREGAADAFSVLATAAELASARGGTLVLSSPPDAIKPALEAAGVGRLVSPAGAGRKPRAAGGHANSRGAHPAGGASPRTHPNGDSEPPAG